MQVVKGRDQSYIKIYQIVYFLIYMIGIVIQYMGFGSVSYFSDPTSHSPLTLQNICAIILLLPD
jgi:hypothetical protein